MFSTILILESIKNIGIALLLLCMFWASNFCFSLYYNINVLKEDFSKDKIKVGIQKIIALVIGLLLLVVALTLMPQFLSAIGFVIQPEWVELFDKLGVVSIIITACMTYGKEAIQTATKIFTNKDKKEI